MNLCLETIEFLEAEGCLEAVDVCVSDIPLLRESRSSSPSGASSTSLSGTLFLYLRCRHKQFPFFFLPGTKFSSSWPLAREKGLQINLRRWCPEDLQPPFSRAKSTCSSGLLSTDTITLFVDFGVEAVGRRK